MEAEGFKIIPRSFFVLLVNNFNLVFEKTPIG